MRRRSPLDLALLALAAAAVSACPSAPPATLGILDGRLAPCPASPNCVSSDATDAPHAIDPIRIRSRPQDAWAALGALAGRWPRTTIVTRGGDYLRLAVRTRVLRFVDDVEFHLRPAEGIVAVRSASRTGYSDLGVNRRRVEAFRDALRESGDAL